MPLQSDLYNASLFGETGDACTMFLVNVTPQNITLSQNVVFLCTAPLGATPKIKRRAVAHATCNEMKQNVCLRWRHEDIMNSLPDDWKLKQILHICPLSCPNWNIDITITFAFSFWLFILVLYVQSGMIFSEPVELNQSLNLLLAGKYADTFEGFLRRHKGQEEVEFHVKKIEGMKSLFCP